MVCILVSLQTWALHFLGEILKQNIDVDEAYS